MDFDTTGINRSIITKNIRGKIPIPVKKPLYSNQTSIISVHKSEHIKADDHQKEANSSKQIKNSSTSNKPTIILTLRSGKKRPSFIPIALSSISAPFASIFRKSKPKVMVNELTPKDATVLSNEFIGIEEPVVKGVDDNASDSNNLVDDAIEVSEQFECNYLEDLVHNWVVIPDILDSKISVSAANKYANNTLAVQENCEKLLSSYSVELSSNLPDESIFGSHEKIPTALICCDVDVEPTLNLPESDAKGDTKRSEQFFAVCPTKTSVLPLTEEFAQFGDIPAVENYVSVVDLLDSKESSEKKIIANKNMATTPIKKDQNIERDVVFKHEENLTKNSIFKLIQISLLCLCLRVLLKILRMFLKN